jgi:hypothetical protein
MPRSSIRSDSLRRTGAGAERMPKERRELKQKMDELAKD